MNISKRLHFLLISILATTNLAARPAGDYRNFNEFGLLGGKLFMTQEYRGEQEIEGFIGANDFLIQKKTNYDFAPYIYGRNSSHLEFGTGFGISGHGIPSFGSNIGLTEFDDSDGFHLHVGIEPAYAIYSANANAARRDYFEWQPMASLGIRFTSENIKWLVYGRGGASVGTLGVDGDSGGRGAYGVVSMLFLFDKLDLTGEVSRILASTTPIDIWDFDVNLRANEKLSLGFHAQAILIRDPASTVTVIDQVKGTDVSEYRIYGSVRIQPFQLSSPEQAI